ncbi:MAG TPA: hypothetical protein VGR35_20560 [Tepidisphaeraceae bacterium]|nr:hypothetical protein [Tepidisphaeraceae bacterium]
MSDGRPDKIAIEHDDYHAKHVGWTTDGRQFILTTPFDPAIGGKPGAEFIALYIFDTDGKLLEAKIDELGPRATIDKENASKLYDQRLQELGEVRFSRIEVAPFSLKRFGTEFGLVVREPEDEEDVWAVEMQPGNYMAFFEPWDSGEYDT